MRTPGPCPPWSPWSPARAARRGGWSSFFFNPHGRRRLVAARRRAGPEGGERIGDGHANAVGRRAVPVGVRHRDLEARRRGVDAGHRLLHPGRDAGGVGGGGGGGGGAPPGGG